MSTVAAPISHPTPPSGVVYPESDGKPMAENTLQFQWIVTIVGGLEDLFADDPDLFVAGDLFWYPVEGRPEVVIAPDALVAFGRPKGHRGSYRQWEEGGVAPQVVFEVLSPRHRVGEMNSKFNFYRRHGVEEYYLYDPDPDRLELSGFLRRQDDLVEVRPMHGHVSPRLGVRFEMGQDGLRIVRPDGEPFVTLQEGLRQRKQERRRADEQQQRAERERERADRLQGELDRLRREAGPGEPGGA